VPNTCRDGGLQMLRCRPGHVRERSVKPLSWTKPGGRLAQAAISALDCRRPVGRRVSRITRRRTGSPGSALPNWAVLRSRRRLTAPLARPPPGSALGAPARHGRAAALAADQPGSSRLTPRAANTNRPLSHAGLAPRTPVYGSGRPAFSPPTVLRGRGRSPLHPVSMATAKAGSIRGQRPSISPKHGSYRVWGRSALLKPRP
jgi:hypothetical protein